MKTRSHVKSLSSKTTEESPMCWHIEVPPGLINRN